MELFLEQLRNLFEFDPGKRGLIGNIANADLKALYQEIGEIKRALIVSGFPILPDGIGETDGPSGAVNIAGALNFAGAEVCLVSDNCSVELIRAGAKALGLSCPTYCVPHEGAESYCLELLNKFSPSHVISIERPGKIDGHYRSMKGFVLDEYVSSTDLLFAKFNGVKIGIGDGGNELGMGNFNISGINFSDEKSDFPLVAGVSNWWGWGIGAMVSVNISKNILPSLTEEKKLQEAIVKAGAIDGITKKNEVSVDGVCLEDNLKFLSKVHEIVDAKISRG